MPVTQAIRMPIPTIRSGPNAGQPRPITGIVIEQLEACRKAAIGLKRDGYVVLSAHIGEGMPTIQIQSDSRTDEAVDYNHACYYKHETLDGFPRRWGQMADKPFGVRVIFCETPR